MSYEHNNHKKKNGFITITFVLIIAAVLGYLSLEANNLNVLLHTLVHIEVFYEQEFQDQSCSNLESLQALLHDPTFISPCNAL